MYLFIQLSELTQRWVNEIDQASKKQQEDSNRSRHEWEAGVLPTA